jgi:hypothetical protein
MSQGTKEGRDSMKQSGVGRMLKGLSVIFAILCFIGGIVAGNSVGSLENLIQYGDYGRSSFNWSSALGLWLMGAVFCALIYAIGEIVDQLASIRQTVEGLSVDLKARSAAQLPLPKPVTPAIAPPVVQPAPAAVPEAAAAPAELLKASVGPEWVYCPSCGTKASKDFVRYHKTCPECRTPYEL